MAPGQIGVAQSPQPSRSSGIVLVKNASGADRNRFDVLGVSGMLYGPADNLVEFQSRPCITGVTLAASS